MKKVLIVLAALCLLTTAVLGVMAVSADSVMYGDLNGDGKINNRDLGLFQKYLNGTAVDINEDAADVYYDGKLNNRDLGILQKFLNGSDVTMGPEEPDIPGNDDIFNDTELDWT